MINEIEDVLVIQDLSERCYEFLNESKNNYLFCINNENLSGITEAQLKNVIKNIDNKILDLEQIIDKYNDQYHNEQLNSMSQEDFKGLFEDELKQIKG